MLLPERAAVVPIGAPGSGKTTLLARMAAEAGDLGFRHGPDDVRLHAFGTLGYQGAGQYVHAAARAFFAARLASGRAAAFDATNTTRTDRQRLLALAQRFDAPTVALLFDVSDAELLARNDRRPPALRVPAGAMLRFAARARMVSVEDLHEEGFDAVHTVLPDTDDRFRLGRS